MKKPKLKIVVVVEGGNIAGIFSTNAKTECVIVDHDNLKEEGKTKRQREKIWRREIEFLSQVF